MLADTGQKPIQFAGISAWKRKASDCPGGGVEPCWRGTVGYTIAMADAIQTVFTVGMPTLAVLVGILVNNSRLSDLRSYMDVWFNDLNRVLDARFAEQKAELLRVEQVMDARLRHIEETRRP